MITQEYLKECLHYDPDTGLFTWLKRDGLYSSGFNKTMAGKIAGSKDCDSGYIIITINKTRYRAHRLAWLYIHGEFPEVFTDHINGVRDDNRISNLRAVSKQENAKNSAIKSNNKSGFNGVDFDKRRSKWRAQITEDGRNKHIGYFETKELAVLARHKAEVTLGFHKNHGRAK